MLTKYIMILKMWRCDEDAQFSPMVLNTEAAEMFLKNHVVHFDFSIQRPTNLFKVKSKMKAIL